MISGLGHREGKQDGVRRDLRGYGVHPRVARPALLVIDMQRYFCEMDAPAFRRSFEEVMPAVQNLVDMFVKKRLPVFATRYHSTEGEDPVSRFWGGRLERDSEWTELDPRLRLPADAAILDKHLYGTFSSTDIESELRATGADSVVICGVKTDLCCETTAREAFEHDYVVFFVSDGTATDDDMLHLSALSTLAHGFAYIRTVDEVEMMLEGLNG